MPSSPEQGAKPEAENVAREALKFVLSPQGSFFRDFLMTEIVQSIDALSRKQVQVTLTLTVPGYIMPNPLPAMTCRISSHYLKGSTCCKVIVSQDHLMELCVLQLLAVINRFGIRNLPIPILVPGGIPTMGSIAPALTASDEKAVDNVMQLTNFLTGGSAGNLGLTAISPSLAQEASAIFYIHQACDSS